MDKTLRSFRSMLLLILIIAGNGMAVKAQLFNWVKGIGGTYDDWGYKVAADDSGNVFATGWFKSRELSFNTVGTGSSVRSIDTVDNGPDIYLVKYDAAGNYKWGKVMGGRGIDESRGLATDKNGSIYVTGLFDDTADFNIGGADGKLIANGENDIFLAKYDKDGNFLWAKGVGGSKSDMGMGVAIDANGNVYITGSFVSDTLNFNLAGSGGKVANYPMATGGSADIFLAKYDAGGNFAWAKSMGGWDWDGAVDIAADRSGSVFITGSLTSFTSDFNRGGTGGTINIAGSFNSFLAKYDAAGNYLWVRHMGVIGNFEADIAMAVAVDGLDNAYITGYFNGPIAQFNRGGNGGVINNNGFDNGFLAKYDGSGNYQWAKALGGIELDYASGVAADAVGNVYVAGHMDSPSIDFNAGGTGGVVNNRDQSGLFNLFLAKYNTNGDFRWAKRMGGSGGWDQMPGSGLTADLIGNVYLTGYLISTKPDFDPGDTLALVGSYNYDAFVVKYSCIDTVSSHVADTACNSYTFNNQTYTEAGVYEQHFPSVLGCDSTVVFSLTLDPVEKPVITIDGFRLGTAIPYTTYQWFKDGVLIPGATDASFTVSDNGDYSVVGSNTRGCLDTSDIYSVTNTGGIGNMQPLADDIKVYPNPSDDVVFIQSPIPVNVVLTDMEGRIISATKNTHQISLKGLATGIYLVHMTDSRGTLIKVVKQTKQSK